MKLAYSLILERYRNNHQFILAYAEKLTNEQLCWQAVPGSLSIAFYLWHMGRWADHLQATIPGMTPTLTRRLTQGRQLWEKDNLAGQWGFDSATTGYAETGMDMDEAVAARLVFPSREVLLDYVRRTFALVEQAVKAIDEDQFLAEAQPQSITEGVWQPGGSVGSAVMEHLLHDCLHLGMMEALLGLQLLSQAASV